MRRGARPRRSGAQFGGAQFGAQFGLQFGALADALRLCRYNGDFKLVFKVPMTKPMEMTVRMFVKHDFPAPGDVTWVYRGLKDGQLDMSPGAPVGKGYIKAVDGNPGACVIVSVEELPKMMARMPKFLVNWLLASFTPKYLVNMCAKYKQVKGL